MATPAGPLLARTVGTPRGDVTETDDETDTQTHEPQTEADILSIHTAPVEGEESVSGEGEEVRLAVESTMSFTGESKTETIPEVEPEVDDPTPTITLPSRKSTAKLDDDDSDDVSLLNHFLFTFGSHVTFGSHLLFTFLFLFTILVVGQ